MKTAFVLLLAAICAPAVADDDVQWSFDDRVWLAQAAEEDQDFHPYASQMYRKAGRDLARTMRRCWSVTSKQNAKPFVLVADIDGDGRPRNVEVKPVHAGSRCFATGFSSIAYLPAPSYPGRAGFPIVMRVGGTP